MNRPTELQKHLQELQACPSGIECVGEKTPEEAWRTATHPGMLIWWCLQTPVNDLEAVHAVEVELDRPHPSIVDPAACAIIRERLKCPYAKT